MLGLDDDILTWEGLTWGHTPWAIQWYKQFYLEFMQGEWQIVHAYWHRRIFWIIPCSFRMFLIAGPIISAYSQKYWINTSGGKHAGHICHSPSIKSRKTCLFYCIAHGVAGSQVCLIIHTTRWEGYGQASGLEVIHGHRTLKAPHPVRSAKLTRVPLS